MTDDCEPESIEDVLECVDEAGENSEQVAVSDIVDQIGEGAFAPLMLVPALIMLSPATAMFGVASFCGVVIVLITVQMAFGREKLWLPDFLRNRAISRKRLDKAVHWLSKPAKLVDGLTRKRLGILIQPPVDRLWALVCMLAAIIVPVFELVPMSATIMGAAISLFGLAMVAKDGLFVLLGLTTFASAAWLLWGVAT